MNKKVERPFSHKHPNSRHGCIYDLNIERKI